MFEKRGSSYVKIFGKLKLPAENESRSLGNFCGNIIQRKQMRERQAHPLSINRLIWCHIARSIINCIRTCNCISMRTTHRQPMISIRCNTQRK